MAGIYDIGDEVDELLTGGYDEEVIGGTYDVGAAARRRSVPPAVAMQHSRNVATLRQRQVLRPRNIWLPMPATTINTLAQGNIQTQPQVLFRPERLLWPSDTAGSFSIDQILVGKDNQWAAGIGGVPARAFQEDCFQNEDLGLDTAQPNSIIAVLATNFSLANLVARCAIRGQSIQ